VTLPAIPMRAECPSRRAHQPGEIRLTIWKQLERFEPSAVVACSRLEEIVVDDPRTLHRRFRLLGVWQQRQVEERARNGRARALRFVDTEVFPRQVALDRLRELAGWPKHQPVLQGPRRIPSELFAAVYQESLSTP
jgi:hypothetical protein